MFEAKNPAVQFASLGSGSKGNATLVRCGDTLLMIDCGFSLRETVRRMDAAPGAPMDGFTASCRDAAESRVGVQARRQRNVAVGETASYL